MRPLSLSLCSLFICLLVIFPAKADPVPFFDTVAGGVTSFDTQISDVNGTLNVDSLAGLANNVASWDRGDYTITATNAANRTVNTTVLAHGDAINMTADGSVTSGLTYTFNTAINGFGLELDDWATCCYPSSLYIQFDGGSPILVGTATQASDNPGMADDYKTFIGAIDDAGTFTVVTFYGTGAGDALYAGGAIRYALVPIGSISNGYVQVAQTTPVGTLASYLDANDNSGDLQTVGAYLNGVSEEQVKRAIKTIFPVNASVVGQTSMGSMGQTSSVIMEKVGTVLGSLPSSGGGAINNFRQKLMQSDDEAALLQLPGFETNDLGKGIVTALSSMPYSKFEVGDSALWVEGVISGVNGDSTAATLGYEASSKGFVMGYEWGARDDVLLGVMGSMFATTVDLDEFAGETDADNYAIGIYGQKLIDSTKLTGMVSLGIGRYDSVRVVSVGGVNGSPQSDYKSHNISATIGASRLFEHNGYEIEPFSSVSYSTVSTEAYQEYNGGVYNNEVSGDSFSSVNLKVGTTVQKDFDIDENEITLKLKPYIGRQLEIESADNYISLSGGTGSTVINGRDINVYEFGLGAEGKMQFSENETLKLGVDLSRDVNEQRAIMYLGYGYKF